VNQELSFCLQDFLFYRLDDQRKSGRSTARSRLCQTHFVEVLPIFLLSKAMMGVKVGNSG